MSFTRRIAPSGEPPKSFDWEWTDKDGEFHRDGEITPVEFWKKYVGSADLESYVCLVDDPRQEHVKGKKIGRNEPCPCGSGLKFKNCHGKNGATTYTPDEEEN
mgnify:CR=1 FL=1